MKMRKLLSALLSVIMITTISYVPVLASNSQTASDMLEEMGDTSYYFTVPSLGETFDMSSYMTDQWNYMTDEGDYKRAFQFELKGDLDNTSVKIGYSGLLQYYVFELDEQPTSTNTFTATANIGGNPLPVSIIFDLDNDSITVSSPYLPYLTGIQSVTQATFTKAIPAIKATLIKDFTEDYQQGLITFSSNFDDLNDAESALTSITGSQNANLFYLVDFYVEPIDIKDQSSVSLISLRASSDEPMQIPMKEGYLFHNLAEMIANSEIQFLGNGKPYGYCYYWMKWWGETSSVGVFGSDSPLIPDVYQFFAGQTLYLNNNQEMSSVTVNSGYEIGVRNISENNLGGKVRITPVLVPVVAPFFMVSKGNSNFGGYHPHDYENLNTFLPCINIGGDPEWSPDYTKAIALGNVGEIEFVLPKEVEVDDKEIEEVVVKDENGETISEDKTKALKDILSNEAVADFEGTGVKELSAGLVSKNANALKEILKTAESVKDDTDAKALIDEATNIDSKIDIKLTAANIKTVEDSTIFNRLVYDVKPMVKTTIIKGSDVQVVEAVIPNEEIEEALTFRLGIDSKVATGTPVKVYHDGDFFTNTSVLEEGGNKFVELESDNFSLFELEILDKINWAFDWDSGVYNTDKGVVRFLVDSGLEDSDIEISKIVFFGNQVADADASTTQGLTVADTNGISVFSADLFNLNPTNKTDSIYATAMIKVGGAFVWSKVQKFTPTFAKNLGTVSDYNN